MIRGDSSVEKLITTYVFLSAFYSFAQNLSSASNALMMTNRGLSYSTISVIVGSFFVCTLILNCPTGMLADRWGRSKLVVPGYFPYAVGIVCFGVSTRPWHFFGAELCQALSAASLTEALEA